MHPLVRINALGSGCCPSLQAQKASEELEGVLEALPQGEHVSSPPLAVLALKHPSLRF